MKVLCTALLATVALTAHAAEQAPNQQWRAIPASLHDVIINGYKLVSAFDTPGQQSSRTVRTYVLQKDDSLVQCTESHDGAVGEFRCSEIVQPYLASLQGKK
jgi:hypothetical protein